MPKTTLVDVKDFNFYLKYTNKVSEDLESIECNIDTFAIIFMVLLNT